MNVFGIALKPLHLALIAVAVIAAGIAIYMTFFSAESKLLEKLGFRFLRAPAVPTDGPAAYMPAETKRHELPVGGKGAELGATTTWFARGGREGGMDRVNDAKDMGYDRPEQFDIFAKGPAPANVMGGRTAAMRGTELSSTPPPSDVPSGRELLPASETASLLEVDPEATGPGQPVMTSLKDRNNDLSGRAIDFENKRVAAELNDSGAPLDRSAGASASAVDATGPAPAGAAETLMYKF